MTEAPPDCEIVADPMERMDEWDDPTNKIFLIGGGQIFQQYLRYCRLAWITRVAEERPDATESMPDLVTTGAWHKNWLSPGEPTPNTPRHYFEYWENLRYFVRR